jgi:hypothetical protein
MLVSTPDPFPSYIIEETRVANLAQFNFQHDSSALEDAKRLGENLLDCPPELAFIGLWLGEYLGG